AAFRVAGRRGGRTARPPVPAARDPRRALDAAGGRTGAHPRALPFVQRLLPVRIPAARTALRAGSGVVVGAQRLAAPRAVRGRVAGAAPRRPATGGAHGAAPRAAAAVAGAGRPARAIAGEARSRAH